MLCFLCSNKFGSCLSKQCTFSCRWGGQILYKLSHVPPAHAVECTSRAKHALHYNSLSLCKSSQQCHFLKNLKQVVPRNSIGFRYCLYVHACMFGIFKSCEDMEVSVFGLSLAKYAGSLAHAIRHQWST